MKVVLDAGLCEGNAICSALAPDVFEMTDDDLAVVVLSEPSDSLRDAVQRAVDSCPRLAIRVEA